MMFGNVSYNPNHVIASNTIANGTFSSQTGGKFVNGSMSGAFAGSKVPNFPRSHSSSLGVYTYITGDGLVTTKEYDQSGALESIRTG
jgi:hypothetical protein